MIKLSPELRRNQDEVVKPFRAWWPHNLNDGRELIKAANALDELERGCVIVKNELRIDNGTDDELLRYMNSVDAMEAGCIAVFEK